MTEPAKGFRPRREIEWFLHGRQGENKTLDAGFLTGASLVRKILSVDAEGNRDTIGLLEGLERDFGSWLGESRPEGMAVSRLANSDKDALWEYSPFLCGASLLEALEVSYQTGIHVMERLPAVTTVAYLYRLLITCPTTGMKLDPLYNDLDTMLRPGFFVDGKLPTSNFGQALSSRVAMRKRNSQVQPPPRSGAKKKAPKTYDIYQSLDSTESPFSSVKSTVTACRNWNWNIDDLPDDDLQIGSVLFMIRLGSQKLEIDPATGKTRLPDTDITKRALGELGQKSIDETMRRIFDYFPAPPSTLYDGDPSAPTAAGWGQNPAQPAGKAANSRKPRYFNLTGLSILGRVARADICHEMCGSYPIHAINYMTLTAAAYQLLSQMYVRLGQLQNPLFERRGRAQAFSRMLSLGISLDRIYLAMEHQDPVSLRIMAGLFRGNRSRTHQFMYWGHKETEDEMDVRMERAAQTDAEDGVDGCGVM
jgi:hypothetical protein